MNVLVVGAGAREHALCWKIRSSPLVTKIFSAPGNPGTQTLAEAVPHPVSALTALADFAEREQVALTIVGPEEPLALGIVDHFRSRGLTIFGPTKAAARIEASKSFAKEVMGAAKVPTATYQVFESRAEALTFLQATPLPVVLKVDGLAGGKGVVVCRTREDAERGLEYLFGQHKATAVIVEEFLEGREASFIVATDGHFVVPLLPAHDYKRIADNDTGPNTGGMGSVCPTPRLSPIQTEWAIEHIVYPTLRELDKRAAPFSGFLYAGLMIEPNSNLKVLEFNARLGDPEAQSILTMMESDIVPLLLALAQGARPQELRWRAGCATAVVLAAAGYPDAPRSGDVIEGIEYAESFPGVQVFHAGTARAGGGSLVTSGGRVLTVTAHDGQLPTARQKAYKAVDMIQFAGRQCRRDIGL